MPHGQVVEEDCVTAICLIKDCQESFDTKREALGHVKASGHSVQTKILKTTIWRK